MKNFLLLSTIGFALSLNAMDNPPTLDILREKFFGLRETIEKHQESNWKNATAEEVLTIRNECRKINDVPKSEVLQKVIERHEKIESENPDQKTLVVQESIQYTSQEFQSVCAAAIRECEEILND